MGGGNYAHYVKRLCINCGFVYAKNVEKVFYFSKYVLYNMFMRNDTEDLSNKQNTDNDIKHKVKQLEGDSSYDGGFTSKDLDKILLLESDNELNYDLCVTPSKAKEDETSIFKLLNEGTVSGVLTGKDTGIYKYKEVKEEPVKEDDEFAGYEELLKTPIISKVTGDKSTYLGINTLTTSIIADGFSQEYDQSFAECMLAQFDPLGGPQTQVVRTFKGYLEIARPWGILHRSNCLSKDAERVYISEYYIDKYLLRNGDEISCMYTENQGKFVVESLLTINDEGYSNWETDRVWFDEIKSVPKPIVLKTGKEDTCTKVVNGLQMCRGDFVSVYLNDNSRVGGWIEQFIADANNNFDKVVVINPKVKGNSQLIEGLNIVNFCAEFTDSKYKQTLVCLLAANYVKRLVELGKNVVVIADDINAISALDEGYNGEMPIMKTLLSCVKSYKRGGSIIFGVVPFSNEESERKYSIFKSMETVGLVIHKADADVYSSYRT